MPYRDAVTRLDWLQDRWGEDVLSSDELASGARVASPCAESRRT
ncbi:hypothetical protein [Pseudonocardia sp.]